MMYKSIDKRYLYTTMLCELIDKYVVEKLLCSGGGKMGIGDIHGEDENYYEVEYCNSYAFAGIEVKINLTQHDGTTVYKRNC